MTATTETEIRDLLAARERDHPVDRVTEIVEEAVHKAFQIITYTPLDEDDQDTFEAAALTEFWANLSRHDVAELADMVERAKVRACAAAHEAIRQEVVTAALAFGAKHPCAQRVAREEVPA